MSRLQIALHALPPQTLITPRIYASNREVNAQIAAQARKETSAAKAIQREYGGTWTDALRAVQSL